MLMMISAVTSRRAAALSSARCVAARAACTHPAGCSPAPFSSSSPRCPGASGSARKRRVCISIHACCSGVRNTLRPSSLRFWLNRSMITARAAASRGGGRLRH